MEAYLNKSIKEVIQEFPPVEKKYRRKDD